MHRSFSKEIKQFINEKFYIRESDPFAINEILLIAINNHNNIPSSTNYKPIELRDITDEKIIHLGEI